METATEVTTENLHDTLMEVDVDLSERIARLEEKMDTFIALASDIKNAIEPTLESLKNSPIGKMFL